MYRPGADEFPDTLVGGGDHRRVDHSAPKADDDQPIPQETRVLLTLRNTRRKMWHHDTEIPYYVPSVSVNRFWRAPSL
eukprot:4904274-Pyramimonas_sp.AAC.1